MSVVVGSTAGGMGSQRSGALLGFQEFRSREIAGTHNKSLVDSPVGGDSRMRTLNGKASVGSCELRGTALLGR